MDSKIALCFLFCIFYTSYGEVDIITEPRPGEEYVLVSSGQQTPLRNFETSHKIPEKHPNHRLIKPEDGDIKIFKKLNSGKLKHPTEGIISIEEDKKALFKKGQKTKASESIEVDIPTSKLEDIKIKENLKNKDFNSKMAVDLEAMSESGKLRNKDVITTQKPVLTTSASPSANAYEYIPINFDTIDEVNSGLLSSNVKLESAGSEQKQHSRIQVKKGPNGQDYEYEYIYYYYDEEDDSKKEVKDKVVSSTTTSTTTAAPVQKLDNENKIFKESKSRNKYTTLDRSSTTTTAAAPEAHNEIVPAVGRSRSRGRNVAPAPVEEESHEERLPSSTRFPPRGRSFAAASSTTYVPEVTSETRRHRGRSQVDNVAVESTGQTRSRMRAHIRRPSSELVDLDSFKVHSGDIPSSYKEQPSRYSSESKTTTEFVEVLPTVKEPSYVKETQREGHSLLSGVKVQEILDDSKMPSEYKQTTTYEQDTTEYTTMTAMEKVALDLYAYLAGENLNNEISSSSDLMSFDESTTMDDDAWTTEPISTTEEETTPTTTTTTTSTTTTTTTTTTPEPTTTTTTAPTRPSRFKGRAGARSRSSASTSAATEAPQETSTRVKGRFGKPNGIRKTTAAAVAVESSSSASPVEKPAQPKPFGRRGLFGGRTRPSSTTAAPSEAASSSVASEAPVARSRLRPSLRKLPSSTSAAPSSAEVSESTSPASVGASAVDAETTPAPIRTIGRKPGSRPVSLRPGPRLNIRPNIRVRPGLSSVATTEAASEAPAEVPASESPATDAEPEGSSPSPAPEQPRGLSKIRNRLQVSVTPKPRAAVIVPLRRPNPLLKKRLPSTEAPTEAPKKSTEAIEEVTSAEKSEAEVETEAPVPETTAAPQLRGLDALIARRRAAGIGGRPVRPVRRAPIPK